MNARKSVLMFISQILIIAVSIITNKLIFTVINPADYGLYGYAFSTCALFFIFSDMQFQNVFFKRIAEKESIQKHYSTYMFLKNILICLSVVSFIVYVTYKQWNHTIGDMREIVVLSILMVSYIADAYMTVLSVILLAGREVKKSQLMGFVIALSSLIYTILFIYPSHSLNVLCFALFFKSIIGVFVAWCFLKNEISLFNFSYDKAIGKDYIKFVIPLLPITILGTLYDKLDTIFVKNFISNVEAGYFAAAQKFNMLLLLPSGSIMTILYASFSESASRKDFNTIQMTSNKATKYVSLMVTLLSIFVFFYANEFVRLFMSNEYVPVVPIIRVFMIQVILMSVSRTMDTITMAAERLKVLSIFAIILYVVGILLNIILIPEHIMGIKMFGLKSVAPAVKSLIIYIMSISFNGIYLYKKMKIVVYWRFLFHIAVAMISGFLISIVPLGANINEITGLTIRFILFALLYSGTLWLIREITKEDIKYLLKVFLPGKLKIS